MHAAYSYSVTTTPRFGAYVSGNTFNTGFWLSHNTTACCGAVTSTCVLDPDAGMLSSVNHSRPPGNTVPVNLDHFGRPLTPVPLPNGPSSESAPSAIGKPGTNCGTIIGRPSDPMMSDTYEYQS